MGQIVLEQLAVSGGQKLSIWYWQCPVIARYLRRIQIKDLNDISGCHEGEYADHCLLEFCDACAIALMTKAASASETSVNFCETKTAQQPGRQTISKICGPHSSCNVYSPPRAQGISAQTTTVDEFNQVQYLSILVRFGEYSILPYFLLFCLPSPLLVKLELCLYEPTPLSSPPLLRNLLCIQMVEAMSTRLHSATSYKITIFIVTYSVF